jgi:hypothetical protein
MKYARSALLVSAAIAGLAVSASSTQAQTTTVAAFFDPTFTSATPMFFRSGPSFTGGWNGTGLTLFTPGLPAVPDFNNVTFQMTPLAIVGGVYPQETLSGGTIVFFDQGNAPLMTMTFDAAHLSPFGFGAADFFFDNVTFSGPILTGIGAVTADEQFGFSFANVSGTPSNFTATASFTSSARVIIPAPASGALLGLAGLVAGRRRR